MSKYIEPNEHGGFIVWQSIGAAREHIGTFKRRKDAEQFCASDDMLAACKHAKDVLWHYAHGETPGLDLMAGALECCTLAIAKAQPSQAKAICDKAVQELQEKHGFTRERAEATMGFLSSQFNARGSN
jgi:hypothetical protein